MRLRRGKGWVRAPSDRVVARLSFPAIRSLDSSATLRRLERDATRAMLVPANPARLAAALAAMATGEDASEGGATPADARAQVATLRQRLRQQEDELAAAQARIAELADSARAQEQ